MKGENTLKIQAIFKQLKVPEVMSTLRTLLSAGLIIFMFKYVIPTPWSSEFSLGFAMGVFLLTLLTRI